MLKKLRERMLGDFYDPGCNLGLEHDFEVEYVDHIRGKRCKICKVWIRTQPVTLADNFNNDAI